MNEPPRATIAALLTLTFVTGLVDAASVLGLGKVFTANMTGNVVFLGFALAHHEDVSITSSCVALAAFMVGAAVSGRLVRRKPRALHLALGLELSLLVVAATVAAVRGAVEPGTVRGLVALLGAAMGMRNAVVRHLAVADLTTTVLTLTVTGLAADSSLAAGDNPRWERRLAAVIAMLGGAWAGALLLRLGMGPVIGAAAVVEAVAVVVLARSLPHYGAPA